MKTVLLTAGSLVCFAVGVGALLIAIDVRGSAPGTSGFMPALPIALASALLVGAAVALGLLALVEWAAEKEARGRGGS